MKELIQKALNRIKWILRKRYSVYNGVILPPIETRLMGDKFFDNKYYFESSIREGEKMKNKIGIDKNTEMLEIGCASGRSVIGLIEVIGTIKKYVGLDINRINLEWCRKYIGRKNKFCRFELMDLKHILYNQAGTLEFNENFRLPFNDGSFNLVYVQSVFPNNTPDELKIYAKEMFRLLRSGGTAFVTNFIEENVPEVTENPEGYKMKCTYPRQIMRYEKNFFLKLFTDAGFVVDKYEYGVEVDGQSAVYLSKAK